MSQPQPAGSHRAGHFIFGLVAVGVLAMLVLAATTPAPTKTATAAPPATPAPETAQAAPPAPAPEAAAVTLSPHAARAERLARRFLIPCRQKDSQDQQNCWYGQQTFVAMYVAAMAGDFVGAVYMMGSFQLPTSTAAAGVRPDPAQACAWATFLSLTTGHNPAYDQAADHLCAPLGLRAHEASQRDLQEITKNLDLDAGAPDGWKPIITGLRGP